MMKITEAYGLPFYPISHAFSHGYGIDYSAQGIFIIISVMMFTTTLIVSTVQYFKDKNSARSAKSVVVEFIQST